MATPTVDLTTAGTSGTIGGAVFTTNKTQGGTGIFDTFVQLQHNGVEQGYNTDAKAQFDEKSSHNFNHSILLADVPLVFGDGSNGTQEGVVYREFLFDANELNGAGGLLSLDKLQIWQEESGSLTNFTSGSGFAGAHTNYLAYDLDAGGDHWVALNAGLSSGSGKSDMRVLIPDSYFLNDPAHRYVTLYSEFGLQGGNYGASGGFEEWGLSHVKGTATQSLVATKTAVVPGGTADTVGESIDYSITVANVGNANLTGITVTDPGVSNLATVTSSGFNIGDVNHDGILNAGETWRYTAQHVVTQSDIDTNGGGDGTIDNTVTADSDQTNPVVASASIAVERRVGLALDKTPDVTSVDHAGQEIHYTIGVSNSGNTTFTGLAVSDPQITHVIPVLDTSAQILGPYLMGPVLSGDYNVGDLNQNGLQDPAVPPSPGNPSGTPAEVFVYTIVGDENHNGVQDPGEIFTRTNIGDLNQNGVPDPGETFQFYNVGDTNHNGVEDPGETFQILVNHNVDAVDANHDGFNDGDTNLDGILQNGETWLYAVTHTMTQAEIDNGGVVQPGLTIDNTATVETQQGTTRSDSTSVLVVQNPAFAITKTADVTSVDAAGDVINYTVVVDNTGNMTLTGVAVSDSLTGLTLASGDTDNDGKLDVDETWTYTGSYTVTQADIDNGGAVAAGLARVNTATADTAQTAPDTASASVAIVQNPDLTITKTADVASVDAAGDVINYTVVVDSTGNMTLTGVTMSDALAGLTLASGDTDNDGKLDLDETWTYTGSHTVTQAEMDGTGPIANTASVTTGQGTDDSATASVAVLRNPSLALQKVGTFHDVNGNGYADAGIDTISFVFTVTNDGNTTQQTIGVNDPDGAVTVSGSPIASLAPGASDSSWTGLYTITSVDVANGFYDDTAVATSLTANATDTEHVVLPPAPPPPGPRLTLDISDNVGTHWVDSNENGHGDAVGGSGNDLIQFSISFTNTGSDTITNIGVSDALGDAIAGNFQNAVPASLAPGASWVTTFNHFLTPTDAGAHHVSDTVTVTALDSASQALSIMATWDQIFPA